MERTLVWPKTWLGWKRLFWLFLRRCPIDHGPLLEDPWDYGCGSTLYCFKCDGVSVWPRGATNALKMNALAEKAKP